MNEITKRIKEIFKDKGLTQVDVARKMGITSQTLSDKLNRHGNFAINFLISLEDAIGEIDYNFIFHGTQKNVKEDDEKKVDYEFLLRVLQEKIEKLEGKYRDTEYLPKVA